MEKQIVACDKVIVICTPTYASRVDQRQGGAGYEQQIISGHIAAGVPRQKFVPVIRRGNIKPGRDCAIPTHFSGIYAVDMRKDAEFNKATKTLLLAIYGERSVAPPKLGTRVNHRSRSKRDKNCIRLPIMDLDGWHLVSGVAMNQEHPKTFEIPPERVRQNVKIGDYVKLIFEIAVPQSEQFGGSSGERMWVKVTGKQGGYYLGTLANQPLSFDQTDALKFGDRIVFLPEHVIRFDRQGKSALSSTRARSKRAPK
jgi:hypothetical protein